MKWKRLTTGRYQSEDKRYIIERITRGHWRGHWRLFNGLEAVATFDTLAAAKKYIDKED